MDSIVKKLMAFDLNKPVRCEKCGSVKIKYLGIGEYKCSDCGFLMYDDYGIVRNYIEKNPGVTQAEVSKATGIKKSRITQLLKEDKIEIAPGSSVFLFCELCGKEIRSGRYCFDCSKTLTEKIRDEKNRTRQMSGYTVDSSGFTGEMRFRK